MISVSVMPSRESSSPGVLTRVTEIPSCILREVVIVDDLGIKVMANTNVVVFGKKIDELARATQFYSLCPST